MELLAVLPELAVEDLVVLMEVEKQVEIMVGVVLV
jgi:hypothetical protein